MHASKPIPVLPEPAVTVGGGLGQQAERGAAVRPRRPHRQQFAPARLLAEQGEGQLVARIEQRNACFAVPAAVAYAPHFFGIGGTLCGDRQVPSLWLQESLVMGA